MKLVILGAGGYGRTIRDLAEQSGRYEAIRFLDDNSTDVDVMGKCGDFTAFISDNTEFYPAFGNNAGRLAWLDKLKEAGAEMMTFVHPTAYVSPKATVGEGSVILPKAIVNTDTRVERGVIINCGAIVDHGCAIGEGAHICLGAIVKAENKIPPRMKVEAGEVIENRTFR